MSIRAHFESLQHALGQLRDRLGSMSEEQLSFRPSEDAWSLNQVAHHLLQIETLSVETMEKNRNRPSKPRSFKQSCAKGAVAVILSAGIRVKNPTRSNPDTEARFEDLDSAWTPLRQRMEFLVTDSNVTAAGIMHPYSGPLNREEAVDFLAKHFKHHLKQVDRIRGRRDFPTA